jgi:hypothetical protein
MVEATKENSRVPEVSKYNSILEASVCSYESTHRLASAGETQRPSSCGNLHNNNRNKDISSCNNNTDSDTESDLWTLIQAADNLEPDLAFNWINLVDDGRKVVKFPLIHAVVFLKAPSIVVDEALYHN